MELRSGHRLLQEQRAGQPVGPLPPAARPAFEEGCRLLFSRWTALRLAVENEWGGAGSRDKEAWLLRESVGWFYHGRGGYWWGAGMDGHAHPTLMQQGQGQGQG